ncbi:GNAT family N-acetyltransferase [Planococcus sp. X10-3]|uniref:GNAT family N-acetyltransferase n=1 Tax=Planococcus sp. X10-3 TaxID=3061240 RepID=UPI003BB186B0
MFDYEIRMVLPRDLADITKILNTSLSFGLATTSRLVQKVNSPLSLSMIKDGSVIAYISAKELRDLEKEFLFHEDIIEVVKTKFEVNKSIIVTHIVVDEQYRNQGLGSILLETLLSNSKFHNYFTVGWEKRSSKKWDAEKIFKKEGFEIIFYKENYWLRDSLLNDYSCPYCNTGCLCSAKICFKPSNIKT